MTILERLNRTHLAQTQAEQQHHEPISCPLCDKTWHGLPKGECDSVFGMPSGWERQGEREPRATLAWFDFPPTRVEAPGTPLRPNGDEAA